MNTLPNCLNIVDAHTKTDERLAAMREWVATKFPGSAFSIAPVAGDASFRRYFRVIIDTQSFIVMDAPPDKEDCHPYVAVARAFENSRAQFPRVIAENVEQGYLLLSDFGDQQLLSALHPDSADRLYRAAMDALIPIQHCTDVPNYVLPNFDAALYWREFSILDTWYIKKNLDKKLSDGDAAQLKKIYQFLIDALAEQPVVFVHRDYHSRNIMLCENNTLGILDFQDAVRGPITYDLVSLLRDCYIAWPDEKINQWVNYFHTQLKNDNQLDGVDFATFMRWFDFAGLQRHLKCLGIFSRLHYRDHKNNYLKEIPRVLEYVMKVCDKYPELYGLKNILIFDSSTH